MSPPGRPKGEFRRAQPEGTPVRHSRPAAPKGALSPARWDRAKREGAPVTRLPSRPTQRDFGAALLDPERPVPLGLKAWNGSDPRVRFGVHRNNVVVSLVAALQDTFPVARQLVGDEFFAAMARIYVCEQPPASPVLTDYGDGFGDWLVQFEPVTALPYLADMARLERARVRAFHAADAAALGAGAIAQHLADPQCLPRARLALHPSLSVLMSPFAVVSLWSAHQSAGAMPTVAIDDPEAALVLRAPDDEVLVIAIPPAAAIFVRQLDEARTLGAALEAASSAGSFDLAATLTLLIRHGALVAWHTPGDDS